MKNLAKKSFLGLIVVIFLSVTLVGCSSGLSKEKLEKEVASSIEETINTNEQYGIIKSNNSWGVNVFTKFKVEKITLVKRSENEYTGSVTIIGTSNKDRQETFTESITVIADKDSFQWEFK